MSESLPSHYPQWLSTIKSRIHTARQQAVLAVSREMLGLYWQIGHEILERQQTEGWGAHVVKQLAHDLKRSFPDLKGFSRANLMYMRAFADAWPDFTTEPNVQQSVGQIPWGHNLLLLSKLKDRQQRLQYGIVPLQANP